MNEWNHQKKSYFFVYFVEQFHGLNINRNGRIELNALVIFLKTDFADCSLIDKNHIDEIKPSSSVFNGVRW